MCGCCEITNFSPCGVKQNLHVFNLYRNPNLDDQIFYCLLTSVATVQAEYVCASFLFVGDLNAFIWSGLVLRPRTVMVLQPLTSQLGCDQLMVVGPTHASGGTLGLQMTDVPDLVQVAVVKSIGNSDHSSLLAVIFMAQAVPNLCVSRKIFVKHHVNWNAV